MDTIYSWVRNLGCFYIFMTVILRLLPKESYRKYVRFFTGLLLVILVVSPALSLFGKEEVLLERISQAGFFQELDSLKLDTAHLQETQKETYQREYEKSIGVDVSQMAQSQDLVVYQTEVELSEEYQVAHIYLEVGTGETVSIAKAVFSDNDTQYPAVHSLKQNIIDYYQIEEEQVEIAVRGGQE